MVVRTLHIGVGGRGVWPVRLFPQRDDIRPVGLCDIRPAPLQAAREATGLDEEFCHEKWREALETVDCDAVVVITPPQLHFEMCLAAVKAGRHVMVEKPFTMNLPEACEVVREAEARGMKVLVCQNARYSPGNATAMELVASGEVGRPQFGIMTRFDFRPGVHHSGVQAHSYAWERGIHDFDTAWSLFQDEPRRIQARSFNPSWSPYRHGAGLHAILEFEGGGTCCLSCSFMSRGGGGEWRVECEGGSMAIGSREVLLRRPGVAEEERIEAGVRPAGETVLTDEFVAWLSGGPEPVAGMHQNLQVVTMVEAAGVSSDEGRPVDIQAYLEACR